MTGRSASGAGRAAILRASLIVGLLCFAWAVLTLVTGGIDIRLAGNTITSHDPLKPLLAAGLALSVHVLAGGIIPVGWIIVLARPFRRIGHTHIAWTLAIVVVILGVIYGSRAIGGSDSYGYATEADMLLQGSLVVEQSFVRDMPWPDAQRTFAPMAYAPWPRNPLFIANTCAPGLPVLLAVAKFIGGQMAMFLVAPLGAGALILGTYYVGRRLGSGWAGVIGAWLVATSAQVLFGAMTMLTDVPNAALWAAAFCVLWSRSRWRELAAGLICSLAVMIRPNLAPMVAFLALDILVRSEAFARPLHAGGRAAVFCLGVLPGAVAVAAFNAHVFGSPIAHGAGTPSDLFRWAHVPVNVRNYVGFFVDMHTPIVLAGVVAIFAPLRWIWPAVVDRRIFISVGLFVAAIWSFYFAYDVLPAWWYLRFMVPTWPFIMVGVGAVALALIRVTGPAIKAAIVCGIIALGIAQLRISVERSVWTLGRVESRFIVAAQLAQKVTEPNSVIMSSFHGGSVRYYAGRMTMRYDLLDPAWFDRAVDWLTSHGVHVYLLVEDFEAADAREKFQGSRHLKALDRGPIAVYREPGNLFIYDLSEPDAILSSPPVVVTGLETGAGWGAVPPAPRAPFVVK